MEWRALSSAATLLLAAQGVLVNGARTTSVRESSASCTATASSASAAYSDSAFVDFGRSIGVHVCDGSADVNVTAVTSEVATAFARAVAYTNVDCTALGDAVAEARAVATAEATATNRAEALLDGFLEVTSCAGCSASTEFLGNATKEEFLEAAARSESAVKVISTADDRDAKSDAEDALVVDLERSVLEAFAGIVATASVRTERDRESCRVDATGCAGIFTESGKEEVFGCCEVDISSTAYDFSPDVTVIALEDVTLAAAMCAPNERRGRLDTQTVAETAVLAYAEAVSSVDAVCAAESGGSICAWGESGITAFADAHGTAFALALASADNGCGCTFDAGALAEAVTTVWADATSTITSKLCADGEGVAFTSDSEEAISAEAEDLTAVAIAQAFISGDSCGVYAAAFAGAGGDAALCEISGRGRQAASEIDALASAAADAQIFLCDGDAEAEASNTAMAVAEAWASVTAIWRADCLSTGDAGACAFAGGEVTEVAVAFAEAFAEAWAAVDPEGECDCSVEVDAVVDSMGSVIAEATILVFDEGCIDGDDAFSGGQFESQMVTTTAAAVATALAGVRREAHESDTECFAFLDVTTEVTAPETEVSTCAGGSCKPTGRRCARWEDDTSNMFGCCSADDVCMQTTRRRAMCTPRVDVGDDAVIRTCSEA